MYLEVEIFATFADVNLMTGSGGPVIAQFHTEQHRKSFRKKAKKFANRYAKKHGGLVIYIIDHTKEKEKVS